MGLMLKASTEDVIKVIPFIVAVREEETRQPAESGMRRDICKRGGKGTQTNTSGA